MTNSKKRKLRAILFADIVGYTALMQKDETTARTLLQKFRNTLNKKVVQHSGEIINNYGDGCLCTFESAVDAMTCAKAVQLIFQNEPKVPVRIGLHSGDVFFEDDNVFGDSVNIASRIESLGVAGAVLFSKRIKRDIANQTEFKVQSLGEFDFKNVEKKMEVFGLANEGLMVPKRGMLKGKLKNKKSFAANLWWITPFCLLLLLGSYYLFQNKKETLSDEVLNARIAVLPYANNTNDSTFNVLGEMAADWITRNLMSLEDVKIVQYDNVKDNLEHLQANPGLFQQQTGSEQLIKGKFYLEEADLIFETQIVDQNSSEVLFVFPIIRGNKNKPSAIITELSQRVLGYFTMEDSSYGGYRVAPKYEAFIAMEEGLKYYGTDYTEARKYFLKSMELDSNHAGSYAWYAWTFVNQGQYEKADSMLQVIEGKFKNLSKDGKIFTQGIRYQVYGNIKEKFQGDYTLHQKDPKSFFPNSESGFQALRLNRPHTTLEIYKNLDPALINFDIPFKNWWFGHYATAYLRLERYEEALNILRYVPPEVERFDYLKAQIYVLQNQSDSLQLLIQDMEQKGIPENQILARLYKIAYDFGAKGDTANQLKWGKIMLNRIKNRPESVELPLAQLGNAYFILEDYENMLATYEQVKQKNGEIWEYLTHVGFAYAKMGNMEMVDTFLQKYQDLETPYAQGRYKYAQAILYAGLGNKEEAMRLLRLAFKEGYGFGLWNFNYSYELASLRGYPPFEEFVKPK